MVKYVCGVAIPDEFNETVFETPIISESPVKKILMFSKKIIHQDFRDMKSEKEQLLMPCTFSEKLYSVK